MQDNLAIFLILALATWRLTSLLVNEDGPYNLLAWFRKIAGVYYDEYSTPQGKTVLSRALICVWCFSVWVSAVMALFSPYTTGIVTYFANVLALSAFCIIIEKMIRG